MDEICTALAAKFCATGKNIYYVYYDDELFDCFPEGATRDKETLNCALKELTVGGFADVRYARGSAYCIAGIKTYAPAPVAAEAAPELPATPVKSKFGKIEILQMLSSFAGGAVGAIIAGIISAAVIYA